MHACNLRTYKVEAEGSGFQRLRPGWNTRAPVSQTSKQTSETNSMSSYRKTILEADAEGHCSLNSTGLRGVSVGSEHRALWEPVS